MKFPSVITVPLASLTSTSIVALPAVLFVMFTRVTVGRLFTTYVVEAFTGLTVSLPMNDAVTFKTCPTLIEVLVQLYVPLMTSTVLLSTNTLPSITVMFILPVMLFPRPSMNVPL